MGDDMATIIVFVIGTLFGIGFGMVIFTIIMESWK